MAQKEYLLDAQTGAARYQVGDLLATGRSYQLVQVEPTGGPARGEETLCARAILYDAERVEAPDYVLGRREAMRDEWALLADFKHPLLPEPVDFFEAADPSDSSQAAAEPVMVVKWREGLNLFEWIRREHPHGLYVTTALSLFSELVDFLAELHQAGWVFRDLDPRHFLVEPNAAKRELAGATGELIVGVAGFGNMTKMRAQPNLQKHQYGGSPYVAPEIRGEHEPSALVALADNYGLGALMSFVLTGEEPREIVENPLNQTAYDRLSNHAAPGLSMLVARLIQPSAQNRLGEMEQVAQYVGMELLPTRLVEGFEDILLPAPYSGSENPKNNRALLSKLSPGPLISVEPAKPEEPSEQPAEDDLAGEIVREKLPLSWRITATVLGLITVAALVGLGVI